MRQKAITTGTGYPNYVYKGKILDAANDFNELQSVGAANIDPNVY